MPHHNAVIPAQAGIHADRYTTRIKRIPDLDPRLRGDDGKAAFFQHKHTAPHHHHSRAGMPHHNAVIPAQAGIHADRCTDVSKNIQNLDPRLREDDEKAALFHHRHTALQYRYSDDDIPHDNTVDSREGTRHHNTVIPGKALSTTIPSFPRRRESNLKVYHHVRYGPKRRQPTSTLTRVSPALT